MQTKVIVSGASPDHVNRNTVMRDYVAEGFRQLLGEELVRHVPLQFAPDEIDAFIPDLVLVFGSCMPDFSDYGHLSAACRRHNSKLAFWLHDDPYELDFNYKVLDVADIVFSNDKWSTRFYDHPECHHLPMAASKTAHYRAISDQKDIDVFFCGVGFDNRVRLLRDLKAVLAKMNTCVLGDQWPEDLPFAENRRLDNIELADYQLRSRFTLNIGRHFHFANDRYRLDPSTPGPRTFEAAMAGAVQLYFVESLEIGDYYEDGKEILLFDSVRDLEDILLRYNDAPRELVDIARAAQDRTLREHTYRHRAASILETLETMNG